MAPTVIARTAMAGFAAVTFSVAGLMAATLLVLGIGLVLIRRRMAARGAVPHDVAITARELTTVGASGPAWAAEPPDSSAGYDAILPGYLVAAGASPAQARAMPGEAPTSAGHRGRPDDEVPMDGPGPELALSPAALHLLGACVAKGTGDSADDSVQRHQVTLGDDKVEVVLARAPAVGRSGKLGSGNAWLATSPYLVWAPLPYETPDGGAAFAYLGTGDEGCLFIDLAAAPGFITITGDSDSVSRLAESLAHQLCRQAADDGSRMVVLVDDVVPEPRPAGAMAAVTLRDLGLLGADVPIPETEVVFCTVRASEDALVLGRYVGRSAHRVIPVVLADLPGAPWSFSATAQPTMG
jgi:hypothetical protein